MYLDHFSLKRPPFRITPDPSLFFPGGEHGRGVVLEALIYGVTTGEGILKVVGEVGSGKTMLCRMLEEKLPENIEIVYLANPSLSARDIVYAIAFELKLDVEATTDRLVVMQRLQDYLLKKHGEGGSVVVFIEEAQSMPLETLEEIRLLSNLETHHHKLMQIVLFGQPELDKKLSLKSIRQLKERITHSFNLDPLSVDATREYLRFRMQAAGCPWPNLFSAKAEKLLAKTSTGLTRRINILADKSLLAAYADSSMRPGARNSKGEVLPMVLDRHVKAAIKDSDYKDRFAWLKYAGLTLAIAGFVVLVALITKNLLPILSSEASSANTLSASNQSVVETMELEEPEEIANDPVIQNLTVQVQSGESQIEVTQTETVPLEIPQEEESISIETVQQELAAETVEPAIEVIVEEEVLKPEQSLGVESPDFESLSETQGLSSEPQEVTVEIELAEEANSGLEQISESSGTLLEQRTLAATQWLQQLPETGYTIQLYSVAQSNENLVEEFLQFLQLNDTLDQAYVCWLSGNSSRTPSWIIFYGEFSGVTLARSFINSQPEFIRQYSPYVRNLNEVGCVNDGS